jgi:hypothetical protein
MNKGTEVRVEQPDTVTVPELTGPARIMKRLWLVVPKKDGSGDVRFNFSNPLSYVLLLLIALGAGIVEGILIMFRSAWGIMSEVLADAYKDSTSNATSRQRMKVE